VFERILLTLDGSELSKRATPQALELARHFNSDVVVIEVLPGKEGSAAFSREGARIADERYAREHLEAAAKELRPVARSVEIVTVEGNAGERIVEQAEALGCDVIVMSTHGRSGLGRVLLGSVAEHVVRHSRGATVVLVRPNGDSG
jgi:nucleotide-binding universal stress UspA family protein